MSPPLTQGSGRKERFRSAHREESTRRVSAEVCFQLVKLAVMNPPGDWPTKENEAVPGAVREPERTGLLELG